jgi:hypothetical protein
MLAIQEKAMRRRVWLVLLAAGLATSAGCSREAEKDKNKNLDRPKAAETAKDK